MKSAVVVPTFISREIFLVCNLAFILINSSGQLSEVNLSLKLETPVDFIHGEIHAVTSPQKIPVSGVKTGSAGARPI
jgi:hypothetical protein